MTATRRHFVICLLLISLSIASLGWTSQQGSPAEEFDADLLMRHWADECIDCPHWFTQITPTSLVMDGKGILHAAYGGEALYHAWLEAGRWQVEEVDAGPGNGHQATLAVGPNDELHIVAHDARHRSLRYAHFDGQQWVVETLDEGALGRDSWPSIGVDDAGVPHLVYYRSADTSLRYAYRSASSWVDESIPMPDATIARGPASLAVDSEGCIHIVYRVLGPERLYYASLEGGVWRSEPVAAVLGDTIPALALDATDSAHIAYFDGGILKYAVQVNGDWQVEAVTDGEVLFQTIRSDVASAAVSIALDAGSSPHLATISTRWINGRTVREVQFLHHLFRTDSGWEGIELRSRWPFSLGSGVALATGVGVHIVSNWGATLLHHRSTDDLWTENRVDRGGDVGRGVAMDASGDTLFVSSFDAANLELRFAERVSDVWRNQDLGSASEGDMSLAVDSNLDAYILYATAIESSTNVRLLYSRGEQWVDKYVYVSPNFTDAACRTLTIDVDDVCHIAVCDDGLHYDSFQFSVHESGPLSLEETIETVGVQAASLASDRHGDPHVAYITRSGELKYAFRQNGRWRALTVEGLAPVGPDISLALDDHGRAHIAYSIAGEADLGYAFWNGEHWQTEVVDRDGEVGGSPSIAVAYGDWVHISYYDRANANLRYALKSPPGWRLRTLTGDGDRGRYSALALDSYGLPHVVYYDATWGDLRHLFQPFVPVVTLWMPLYVN